MRTFVAIALPDELRAALGSARAALVARDPGWEGERWVADENLHLTLAFLGDVPDALASDLDEAVAAAVARIAPFDASLGELAAVPNPRSARMIWAEMAPAAALGALAGAVGDAARGVGVVTEERAFAAHVTLARARRPRRVDGVALEAATAALSCSSRLMSVVAATVVESTLTPAGPVYRERRRAPLGG